MIKQMHTPEGVRDIYSLQCKKKHYIDRTLKQVILSHGYEQIETPTFEYFDTFAKEIGSTPSKDLYKFFDREGNTLVLRPDITPSVARAYANYFSDVPCQRFFYSGNVYINHFSTLDGKLRETTQIGAELIGDGSVLADAEIIAMAIKSLIATGLTDFSISVGNVNFLCGLDAAAGFDEEEREEVLSYITNRNYFGLIKLLDEKDVDENIKTLYSSMSEIFSSPEEFRHLDRTDTFLCFRAGNVILPMQPLIGFIDAHRVVLEVEVSRRQG